MKITNEYIYEEVDYSTGEVIKSKRKATYKTKGVTKKYCMITLHKKWYAQLEGKDILLLMEMLAIENPNTWEVVINKVARKNIKETLNISDSQITKSLRNMLNKNIVAKIERGIYVINPECVWIGSSDIHEQKINNYMKYTNLDNYL